MIKKTFVSLLPLVLTMVSASTIAFAQESSSLLKLVGTVKLAGYSGDFDHFAVDQERNRLLLAAEDHKTLEVFDLATSKHLRTVTGFDTPHAILVRKGAKTIFVTDSGKTSMSKLLDAETYEVKKQVPLVPGADSIGYDAGANTVYVVTGGKDVDMKTVELAAVNPETGEKLGAVTFNDNHVEAMAIEKNGPRLFINLAETNKLAVVDRKLMKVIATWSVPPAQQNAMVAFDEARHRLYLVCRKPATVVVLNSDDGSVTNSLPAPQRADDVIFDSESNRLYVPGGEGYVGVYDASNPDHMVQIAKVPSAPGAKTGMLLPDGKRIVLAASPGETKAIAEILTFTVQ